MLNLRLPLAALLFSLAAPVVHGAIDVNVELNGLTERRDASGPGGTPRGTLDFQLIPLDLDNVTLGLDRQFSQYLVEDATFIEGLDDDSLVNTTPTFDLDLTILDETTGVLGTIDIGGTAGGGFRVPANYTAGVPIPKTALDGFLDDSANRLQLVVNGRAITSDQDPINGGELAAFSIPIVGGFLNVLIFDPNPGTNDQSLAQPLPGLSLNLTQSTQAQYTEVPRFQPSADVPEPGTAVIFVGLGGLMLFGRRAGKRRQLA